MSSTQDYLKKYMSKPASLEEHKKRKLKKKKVPKAIVKKGNFAIHDEDEVSWKNAASESEDDLPVVDEPKAPVYKSNSSNWATIREGEPEPSRESTLQRNIVPEWDDVENEDERPSIAGLVRKGSILSVSFTVQIPYAAKETALALTVTIPTLRQQAGSRLFAQIKIKVCGADEFWSCKRKQQKHLDRMRALDPTKTGRDADTVYRDASGRKVDRVQEKIEKAEAARREIEKQEQQMEWGKGIVQREAEVDRKRREEEEKLKPLARYKDDAELNEELKERDRWNDPAAKFLTGVKKSKKAAPKYPLYQGNIPPNRFNIRPGYRWDGVDRSIGFEQEYFQRMNTKKHNAMEAHMWSVEDM
ncbi:Pre-mRNA-splicing factor cwc26 [Mortierella alpina]|uniref:Pre-mRNA-splicing factor cwc26 n=1 Tax=Mortierella alpina TaxID=64518 RepID=A0A9P6J3B0_MORAP|nr:Pre-mRNA-splicing factor cwc26 [Mortierella alpina]